MPESKTSNWGLYGAIVAVILALIGLGLWSSAGGIGPVIYLIAAFVAIFVFVGAILKNSMHTKNILGMIILIAAIVIAYAAPAGLLGQAPPKASVQYLTATNTGTTTTTSTTSLSSGGTYTGELDLPTYAEVGVGGNYNGAGVVFLVDPNSYKSRYDGMGIVQNYGIGALKAPNGQYGVQMTLTGGKFQIAQYQGKINDRVAFFGYFNTSPVGSQNISFLIKGTLTGFNPSSGTNGGVWTLALDSGGNSYQWNDYPQLAAYDMGDTLRTAYTDNITSAATGATHSITYYIHPKATGQQWNDVSLWMGTQSSLITKIQSVQVTTPGGISTLYQTGDFISSTNLPTSHPSYNAMPALNYSGTTMYLVSSKAVSDPKASNVGAQDVLPNDNPTAVRTGSNIQQEARYTVTVTYTTAVTTSQAQNMEFWTEENTNAQTSNNGAFKGDSSMYINITNNAASCGGACPSTGFS